MISGRFLSERPSRSSRQTTSVSPGRTYLSTCSHCGRWSFTLLIFSVKICSPPAAVIVRTQGDDKQGWSMLTHWLLPSCCRVLFPAIHRAALQARLWCSTCRRAFLHAHRAMWLVLV